MWKSIFKTMLFAGILDLTAASLQAFLVRGTAPGMLCRFIASGLFGKKALAGGFEYVLIGLFVHFFIVFCCTAVFFWIYPKFTFLKKSIWLNAFLIALVAWMITTRLIVPLSKIGMLPFNIKNALMAVAILYCCIGLPIGYFAAKFYKKA